MTPRPRVLLPSALGQSSQLVNLQPSVGALAGSDPTDYIGQLSQRITGDIANARANANTDVAGLLSRIKAQNANWKPPIQALPRAQYSVTGRAPQGGIAPGVKISGNVDQWIAGAYKILGIRLTPAALAHERYLIQHESGGNPRAQNNWDSNAKKGTPSMGLAQTIRSTFEGNKVAGHNDIWNPVDNLLASLQYRKRRYGNYDIGNYKGGY
jgi:Transglycosylase SLT domain